MSQMYAPKKGDRVRVVLEGEATITDKNGEFYVEGNAGGNWVYPMEGNVQSVELLAPALPTADGSVVRFTVGGSNKFTVMRDASRDLWRYPDGSVTKDISGFKNHEIIHDAGKGE